MINRFFFFFLLLFSWITGAGTSGVQAQSSPVANFGAYQGFTFYYSFQDSSSGVAPLTYLYNFGDGTTSSSPNITHVYNYPGTYTACLIVTDGLGAQDTFCRQVVITCPGSPVVSFTHQQSFTSYGGPNYVGFNFTGTAELPNGINWTFGEPGANSWGQNTSHNYAAPGQYEVCAMVRDSCGRDTLCDSIWVCPEPSNRFSAAVALRTVNFYPEYADHPNVPATYLWDFGDGNTSTQPTPTHTYAQSGNYQVCLTIINPCSTMQGCRNIVVNCVPPTADFQVTDSLTTVTLLNQAQSWYPVVSTAYSWDFGDGNTSTLTHPTHQYGTPGTYTICLIASDLCFSDTLCRTISVECPVPDAAFSAQFFGQTVQFQPDSITPAGTTYTWDFGDGNTANTAAPMHNYASNGTYSVCLIATNPCGADTLCNNIFVGCLPPIANYAHSENGLNTLFTPMISSQALGTANGTWDFGDGNSSGAPMPSHTYAAAGSYTACLNLQDSCGIDTLCQTITVCDMEAEFSYQNPPGLLLSFADSSQYAGAATFTWDFGDGNSGVGSNVQHTYSGPGFYSVCLTLTDSCGTDSVCKIVEVICPLPSAGFNVAQSGYPFTDINRLFAPHDPNGNVYYWDFGNGARDTVYSPTATVFSSFSFNSLYQACLTVENNCGAVTHCDTFSLPCEPVVADYNYILTGPSSVDFEEIISANWSYPEPVRYLWDFGDGTTDTSANPTHVYASPGSYNVCLKAWSWCDSGTVCKPIIVGCQPSTADFTYEDTLLAVSFQDLSSIYLATSYLWDFGDGNTSTQIAPTHVYATAGNYQVCLFLSDSCASDTFCRNVVVNCPPNDVGFGHVASELQVSFSDSTNAGAGTTYSWDFGDGSTGNQINPNHTYPAAGAYTVCLVVSNSCRADTTCKTINLYCTTTANAGPDQAFCAGDSVLLDAGAGFSNYVWNNGGTTQTQYVSQPGIYVLNVVDGAGCVGKDSVVLSVNPPAVAPVLNDTVLCAGQSLVLDGGSGMAAYSWSGGTTGRYLTVNTAGNYSVTVTNSYNCEDSAEVNVTYSQQQISAGPDQAGCPGDTLHLQASTGFSGYQWSNGTMGPTVAQVPPAVLVVTALDSAGCASNDTVALTLHPVPAPDLGADTVFCDSLALSPGSGFSTYLWSTGHSGPIIVTDTVGVYAVTVSNSFGCEASDFLTLTQEASPQSAFTFSQSAFDFQFSDLSTGTVESRIWDFGDGSTDTTANPLHSFVNPGTYNVCLIVENVCGTDTSCQSILLTGLNGETPAGEYQVYPNPARNWLVLEVIPANPGAGTDWKIINLLGEMIQSGRMEGRNQMTLDVSEWAAGVYFVEFESANQRFRKRFLIAR